MSVKTYNITYRIQGATRRESPDRDGTITLDGTSKVDVTTVFFTLHNRHTHTIITCTEATSNA